MLLLEEHTTLLLVVHAIAAMGTVAISTHLVMWMRPMARGTMRRFVACRRFALLLVGAYGLTMLIGLLLYPTYKVRVRGEYLENPSAISRAAEGAAEAQALAQLRNDESLRFRRGEAGLAERNPTDAARGIELLQQTEDRVNVGARITRWFDVKEHWSSLGFILSAALAFAFLLSDGSKASLAVAKPMWAMAILCCASAWANAVIGLVTAAMRSVSAL